MHRDNFDLHTVPHGRGQQSLLNNKTKMSRRERNYLLILICLCFAARPAVGSSCFNGSDYMCVDWTLGSERMFIVQYKFQKETGKKAFFGVGSYGASAAQNIGKCFQFFVEDQPVPFIAQVTNFGDDVKKNQFDMQMGGGGFGKFNACAAPTNRIPEDVKDTCDGTEVERLSSKPLFLGSVTQWGLRCGGHFIRCGCEYLPDYPTQLGEIPIPPNSSVQEPSLKVLCERAFDLKARKMRNNTVIERGWRIPCPSALVEVTGLQRADEDATEIMPRGVLTSTMDCCAPAGSDPLAFDVPTVKGRERVIPCTIDGYTRVTEVQNGSVETVP